MFIGRVVGSVWATKKAESLEGLRLLIIQPFDLNLDPNTAVVVAADTIGAGIDEVVIVAYGRAARLATGNVNASIEAAVIGIVDSVDLKPDAALKDLSAAAKELMGHGRRAPKADFIRSQG
ncbi:MAG: EutN/CcmL family microcompartment protein [bacterium]